MESKKLKNTNEIFGKVCFGGLFNFSKNAIDLRKKQILVPVPVIPPKIVTIVFYVLSNSSTVVVRPLPAVVQL